MFNLSQFNNTHITFHSTSMFAPDIEANKEKLSQMIKNKRVCAIVGWIHRPQFSKQSK